MKKIRNKFQFTREKTVVMKSKRKIHMDVIRIIAIFLVVYNHTNEKGYYLFSITENPVTYPIYMAMSVFCTIAVPLFFMVSGALLLGKEESIIQIFRKRVVRIILVILIFSFMQYWYKAIWAGGEFSWSDFITKVIVSPIIVPYWYLYAYLSYILMLPFLRSIVKAMNSRSYIYLFFLYFVVSGTGPIVEFFLGIEKINLTIPFLESAIFYPLAGYYFEYLFPEEYQNKKTVIKGITASILAIAVLCILTWYRGLLTGEMSEWGNGLFLTGLTMLPVFTVYCSLKWVCENRAFGTRIQRILSAFSSLTFGIYLLEERFREGMVQIDIILAPVIGWMPACFIWILCVVVCSGTTVVVLKKIPVIKKLL